MNPEQQRITIAEACGWKLHSELDKTWCAPHQTDCPLVAELITIPDYLNDLNAMHEAEKTLNRESRYHEIGGYGLYLVALEHNASATAAQRAEAFLRTLNLWEQ